RRGGELRVCRRAARHARQEHDGGVAVKPLILSPSPFDPAQGDPDPLEGSADERRELVVRQPHPERGLGRRTFMTTALAVGAGALVARPAPAQPAPPNLFPGFEARRIRTSGAEINVLRGGRGPPLLLVHGYPQTHV